MPWPVPDRSAARRRVAEHRHVPSRIAPEAACAAGQSHSIHETMIGLGPCSCRSGTPTVPVSWGGVRLVRWWRAGWGGRLPGGGRWPRRACGPHRKAAGCRRPSEWDGPIDQRVNQPPAPRLAAGDLAAASRCRIFPPAAPAAPARKPLPLPQAQPAKRRGGAFAVLRASPCSAPNRSPLPVQETAGWACVMAVKSGHAWELERGLAGPARDQPQGPETGRGGPLDCCPRRRCRP
jgi:hypothetical protein